MSIALHFAPVPVSDPEAALAFYRDALGLEVLNDVGQNGHRWITLGSRDGGAAVVISNTGAGRSPADEEALEELVVKGALGPWVFATDDLDALFARAVAAGAEVTEEPADQPWGARDCGLRDPSGNAIRVLQS